MIFNLFLVQVLQINIFILFENQIQTTSTSPCRTQVQPAASFLVCSLIFILSIISILYEDFSTAFCQI